MKRILYMIDKMECTPFSRSCIATLYLEGEDINDPLCKIENKVDCRYEKKPTVNKDTRLLCYDFVFNGGNFSKSHRPLCNLLVWKLGS